MTNDRDDRHDREFLRATFDTVADAYAAARPTYPEEVFELRLGRRPDGLVRRHWGAVLHVARAVS